MQENFKANSDRSFAVGVLVIDDNDGWRESAEIFCLEVFRDIGQELNFVKTSTIEDGLNALGSQQFHVVLLDRELVGPTGESRDGVDFIPEILRIQPHVQVLMFTGSQDVPTVVKALQLGASGYLMKEASEEMVEYRRQQLRLAFKRAESAINFERLSRNTNESSDDFVANSPAMKRLSLQLAALAEVSKPVLFVGPTGLGKGAASKRLHLLRGKFLKQPSRPFFNINIAVLSKELAISELFGHEPNSFTGAGNKVKQGYFELSNGGDIFLDEIGEASLELQSRLLKVIEEREFQRMGGSRTLKTNARVIFATNRDLKQMVLEGTFREDLYMRISMFTIELPGLDERKEDIPELIQVFLNRMNKERSGAPISILDLPNDFIEHLRRDGIPGNIRGLENDLSRLIVFSPKGRFGKPNFNLWKNTLGISKKYSPTVHATRGSITFEQFMNLPTDLIRPEFGGLQAAKELLEQKLLVEAERKFTKLTARAEALKINLANASRKYSALRHDVRVRSQGSQGEEQEGHA